MEIIINISYEVSPEILKKQKSRFVISNGDIGIGRVGTIGKVSFLNSEQNYCLSGRIAVIKPKLNSKFLFYTLQSRYFQFQIKQKTDSTTVGVLGIMNLR